ncbi:Ribosomal RNA small subunit methyltransferase I [Eubacterium plexicaudatum ASF492]|nr:Ribosomal RNA small subunit methyltransferase I [Eubacterium plexicaudatum ASF492]
MPRDKKKRGIILEELKTETRTIVIYEAPHHLIRTLEDLYQALGNRKISVCRELTKKHEEVRRTTISDLLLYYETQEPRGEYVLIIEGKSYQDIEKENREDWMRMELAEHMNLYESKGISRKDAMKMVAKDRGLTKRDVYQQLLNQ